MTTSAYVPARVTRFISDKASAYPAIKRVLLFGSRARNDARERSDFDLAVVAPGIDHAKWSRFAIDIEEHIPTLCGVDLLLFDDKIPSSLRTRIEEEGIVIYERRAA